MNTQISNNKLFSHGVIKSNIKRFLPVIMLGFIYFIFIYVFPMLLDHDKRAFDYRMFGVRFYCAAMPLITSVVLFNFLHKKKSVIFHHSIPVTRKQMYISLTLVGLIMINVPTICLGVYASAVYSMSLAFKIILYGFIASSFVFAICNFAGIISGTSVIHFIIACWFNLFVQSMYFVLTSFGEGILKGYVSYDNSFLADVSPITNSFDIISWTSVIYLLVAVIFFVLGWIFYKKLRLERAENAITFNWVKILLNVLVGIYFMAFGGLLLHSIDNSKASFIFGSLVGVIFGVYIGYMIFNKTFKIFNKHTLKLVIILSAVSMLLSLAFAFDIFGFEKKVPAQSEVESVYINSSSLLYVPMESDDLLEDSQNIEDVIKIHQLAVSDPESGQYNNADRDAIYIKYNLSDGEVMTRMYYMNLSNEEVKSILDEIASSSEYQKLEEKYNDWYDEPVDTIVYN